MRFFFNVQKLLLESFKTVVKKMNRGDRSIVKLSIFVFLVCTSREETIELSKLDCLYFQS